MSTSVLWCSVFIHGNWISVKSIDAQRLPGQFLRRAPKLLTILPIGLGSVHVRGALVIRLRQHAHHRKKNLYKWERKSWGTSNKKQKLINQSINQSAKYLITFHSINQSINRWDTYFRCSARGSNVQRSSRSPSGRPPGDEEWRCTLSRPGRCSGGTSEKNQTEETYIQNR